MDDELLNKSRFTKMIEDEVIDKKMSYMDAIIHICETHDIDLDDVRKYISSNIKDKLEVEAMNLNFLPQTNKLPID